MTELAGKSFAFNDEGSLSGHECMRLWLHQHARDRDLALPFFNQTIRTGAHERSLELVVKGAADCAVIDRCVLAVLARDRPALLEGVRILTDVKIGPLPVQPVVVTDRITLAQRAKLIAAFLALPPSLLAHGMTAYYRVVDCNVYNELSKRLRALNGQRLLC